MNLAGNSFGEFFRITTFGESHGSLLGVVIDGLPSGLKISEKDLKNDLRLRKPGGKFVSKRKENDLPRIVSGTFNGKTTGMPLTVLFDNVDFDPLPYEELKYTPRPNHADLPAILKYGMDNFDYRGSGRFSGRETVGRVTAGTIAKKILALKNIFVASCLISLGNNEFGSADFDSCIKARKTETRTMQEWENEAENIIENAIKNGDSVGGVIQTIIKNVPPGLGEPVFRKLKAELAFATMGIPGSTFFEIGEGIKVSHSMGSEVMDSIEFKDKYVWNRNISGGIIGGLSTGMDIIFKVGFKPTGSIPRPYRTIDLRTNESKTIIIKGRHDPAIVIRAAIVVEAMAAIVILNHAMEMSLIPRVLGKEENEIIEKNFKIYGDS